MSAEVSVRGEEGRGHLCGAMSRSAGLTSWLPWKQMLTELGSYKNCWVVGRVAD